MSENEKTISLCAAGDVALGGALEGKLDTPGARRAVVEGVESAFSGSDIRFLNLDCTFDTRGVPPHPDEYLVSASPGQLKLLRELDIDVVSLANNHSMDFGGGSLAATQSHLESLGIGYVGVGGDLATARQPRIVERNGVRVGFLAYASTHPWVGALAAGSQTAGVAPLEPGMMREDVQALREQVDCAVVSVHWGKEYLHYPPPRNVELGRRLVEWGAGLVLGHHPHVIQGIESYRGAVICYSLGNFLFPDYPGQELAFRGAHQVSLLARFRIGRTRVKCEEVLPVCFSDENRLEWPQGDYERELKEQLQEYSAALQRTGYEAFWGGLVRRHEWNRLRRVFLEEVVQAGWRAGIARLLRLGMKNFRSVGRSFAEIFTGAGKSS